MKKLPAFLLILSWFTSIIAQTSSSPELITPVQSWEQTDHGILIRTSNAVVQISCYSPTIVRIRATRQPAQPDFSYAVIRKPGSSFDKVEETASQLLLYTSGMIVKIQKKPLRISFFDRDGHLFSEEFEDFGVTWLGDEVTCHRKLFQDEKFIGLGEKTGPLNRRGQAYVNWNRDIPAYSDREDPLYQSIPFFIGIHDSLTYGIFLDNSFKTLFNFGASTDDLFSFFSAARGEMDYYFFGAGSVAGILEDYTWLTGRMPLPPYWSLGYQQSRWGYYPESEVMSVALKFREKQIPCDVIYFDIDYMDKYKIFTWHPGRFPHPEEMIGKLHEMGFHPVVIIDPGIKIEHGYSAYEEGILGDCFIRYPGGQLYTGNVWPGRCHFPDFTNEKTRLWWGKQFQPMISQGIQGFWNDMNEPSAWGQSIPDIVEFNFDGHGATMAEAHNIYGLEMARATYEGTCALMDGRRPFILTRAGFSGIQRYSAVWTGDNSATDDDLLQGVRLMTSMGLSGISFTGSDVGGFIGSPKRELFLRWLSVGVFTPFFRIHSEVNSLDQEPWSFGEGSESMARSMINFRYRLLPYLYSMFHKSSHSGLPIARSLAIDYTYDPKIYDWNYQNEYLFGDAFLVAPVTSIQQFQKVYLPEGDWYRFSNQTPFKGNTEVIVDAPLDDLPVFVKAGSIVPLQSVVQYTDESPSTVLEIRIYNGERESSFNLYEDDGTTYNYETGDFYQRVILFDPAGGQLHFLSAEGNYPSKFTNFLVKFIGFESLIPDRFIPNEKEEFSIDF